jgi:hypothetical protein
LNPFIINIAGAFSIGKLIMNNKFWISDQTKPDLLASRLNELREALRTKNPDQLAASSGSTYSPAGNDIGEFQFNLWQRSVVLTYPEFIVNDKETGRELSTSEQAMVLYYFQTCDGTGPSGQWISFSELPDGRFYNQAFQGYTGGNLAKTFQNNYDQFCLIAERLGGKRVHLLGDAAYVYNVLPMVNLLVVTWQGDEDFAASYQVLFDAAIVHHLPTDAGAITASILTGRLIAELEKYNENRN